MVDYSGYAMQGFASGFGQGFDMMSQIQDMKEKKAEKAKKDKALEDVQRAIRNLINKPENKEHIDAVIGSIDLGGLSGGGGIGIQQYPRQPSTPPVPNVNPLYAGFQGIGGIGVQTPTGPGSTIGVNTGGSQIPTVTPPTSTGIQPTSNPNGQYQYQGANALLPAYQQYGGKNSVLYNKDFLELYAFGVAANDVMARTIMDWGMAINSNEQDAIKRDSERLELITEIIGNGNLKGMIGNAIHGVPDFFDQQAMMTFRQTLALGETNTNNQPPEAIAATWKGLGVPNVTMPTKSPTIEDETIVVKRMTDVSNTDPTIYNAVLKSYVSQNYQVGWLTQDIAKQLATQSKKTYGSPEEVLKSVTIKIPNHALVPKQQSDGSWIADFQPIPGATTQANKYYGSEQDAINALTPREGYDIVAQQEPNGQYSAKHVPTVKPKGLTLEDQYIMDGIYESKIIGGLRNAEATGFPFAPESIVTIMNNYRLLKQSGILNPLQDQYLIWIMKQAGVWKEESASTSFSTAGGEESSSGVTTPDNWSTKYGF